MSIQVSCDCAMTYRLPDRYAGKRCRCRECGESIRVPRENDARRAAKTRARASDDDDASDDSRAEQRARAKKAAIRSTTRGPVRAPVRERRASRHAPVSESLHQIAPLPLSEQRSSEPGRAMRLAKRATGVGVLARAKKRGESSESESEVRTIRRRRDGDSSDAGGDSRGDRADNRDESDERDARARRRRDDRRRDDDSRADDSDSRDGRDASDSESDEEVERKKKPKRSAPKAAKKPSRDRDDKDRERGKKTGSARRPGRRGSSREADDEDGGDDDERDDDDRRGGRPRKNPNQQLYVLLGSVAFALLSIFFLVMVKVSKDNAAKAIVDNADQIKQRMAKARGLKDRQEWTNAKAEYQSVMDFVNRKDAPELMDAEVIETYGKFKKEKAMIDAVIATQALPSDRVTDFIQLLQQEDPAVKEIGVRLCTKSLGQSRDVPLREVAPFVGASQPTLKAAAIEFYEKVLATVKGKDLLDALVVTLEMSEPKIVLPALKRLEEVPEDIGRFEKQLKVLATSGAPDVKEAAKKILMAPKEPAPRERESSGEK